MFCHVLMRVLLFLWDTTGTLIRVVFPLNLRESLGGKIKRSELDQFEGDLDQIVFACEQCGGLDECHCESLRGMAKRKKSLFDSIEIFDKSLPEIFRDAEMDEEEIEMFRSRFNQDTNDIHAFRIETPCGDCGCPYTSINRHLEWEWQKFFLAERKCDNCGNEWMALEPLSNLGQKLAKLKESMKKGYTPPEDL